MSGFSLPKTFKYQADGTPEFFDGSENLIPGGVKTILTITPLGFSKFDLTELLGTCQFSGLFTVYQNSSEIGNARTGPGSPNIYFSWGVGRPIANGDTIRIDFEARSNCPIAAVKVHLSALTKT